MDKKVMSKKLHKDELDSLTNVYSKLAQQQSRAAIGQLKSIFAVAAFARMAVDNADYILDMPTLKVRPNVSLPWGHQGRRLWGLTRTVADATRQIITYNSVVCNTKYGIVRNAVFDGWYVIFDDMEQFKRYITEDVPDIMHSEYANSVYSSMENVRASNYRPEVLSAESHSRRAGMLDGDNSPVPPLDIVGDKCRACGSCKNLSVDHIIPVSKGGDNRLTNLQVLCRICNSAKNNMLKYAEGKNG